MPANSSPTKPFRGRMARLFLLAFISSTLILLAIFGYLACGYRTSGSLIADKGSAVCQPNTPEFRSLFLPLGIVTLVAFLLIWLFTRQMFLPLARLSEKVQLFVEGNWEQRAHILRRDEVGSLAESFNSIADQVQALYRRLDNQVAEYKEKTLTLAQISYSIAASPTGFDDLLQKVLNLIVRRFGYVFAAVYVRSRGGENGAITGRAEQVPPESTLLRQTASTQEALKFFDRKGKPESTAVRQAIATRKPAFDKRPQSGFTETAIPIGINGRVLGALCVIASNGRKGLEAPLTRVQTEVRGQRTSVSPRFAADYPPEGDAMQTDVLSPRSPAKAESEHPGESNPSFLGVNTTPTQISGPLAPADNRTPNPADTEHASAIGSSVSPVDQSLAELQILADLLAFAMMRSKEFVQPSNHLAPPIRQMPTPAGRSEPAPRSEASAAIPAPSGEYRRSSPAFTGVESSDVVSPPAPVDIQRRLAELEALRKISQSVSIEADLNRLYQLIHKQIIQFTGEISSFAVVLYDASANLMRVPYMYEEGKSVNIPPFPLGQGLSSIVLRTGKPLLLVENTEAQSRALGAITVGAPAKSWLGVPLLFGGEAIGLIIAQDLENEHRFTEEDQRLLSLIASQMAVVVRNARLLETSRRQAELERLVNEISAKLRRSTDVQSILKTTAEELGTALGAYRSQIKIEFQTEGDDTHTDVLSPQTPSEQNPRDVRGYRTSVGDAVPHPPDAGAEA